MKILSLRSKAIPNILCIVLGGTFVYASVDKIAFPNKFAQIVLGYRILPYNLVIPFAFALPWIELTLGILVVVGLFKKESVISLSTLTFIFTIAIIVRAANGEIGPCGCFSVQSSAETSIIISLMRNIGLLAIAGIILAWKSDHSVIIR